MCRMWKTRGYRIRLHRHIEDRKDILTIHAHWVNTTLLVSRQQIMLKPANKLIALTVAAKKRLLLVGS